MSIRPSRLPINSGQLIVASRQTVNISELVGDVVHAWPHVALELNTGRPHGTQNHDSRLANRLDLYCVSCAAFYNDTAVFQKPIQELSSCGDGRPYQSKVGRKVGATVPLFVGGAGSPSQYRLGRSLPPYQVASWSIQPFGHNTRTLQTVIGVAIDSFLCYPVALVTIVKTA